MRGILHWAGSVALGVGVAVGMVTVADQVAQDPGPGPDVVQTVPLQCEGPIVVRHISEPVGCDLAPPQRLDYYGADPRTCDQVGGRLVRDRCLDADY